MLSQSDVTTTDTVALESAKQQIAALLDTLNATAARADYANYFELYTEDAVFMGTDATENWNKQQFMEWSKPAFDKGKAWDFKALERNIFMGKSGQIAWFDELLDTQMIICRGSGVVVKEGNDWKIQQYALSMTIPNSQLDAAIKIKEVEEDSIIQQLKNGRN